MEDQLGLQAAVRHEQPVAGQLRQAPHGANPVSTTTPVCHHPAVHGHRPRLAVTCVHPVTRTQHEPIQVAGPFERNPLIDNRHQRVIEKPIALRDARFHQRGHSVDDPPEHHQGRVARSRGRIAQHRRGARRRGDVARIERGRGFEVGEVAARADRRYAGEQSSRAVGPMPGHRVVFPRRATAMRELSPSSPRRWDRCAPTCHRCARPTGPPRFGNRGATRRRCRRRGRRSASSRSVSAHERGVARAPVAAQVGVCAPRRDSRSVRSLHLHHTSCIDRFARPIQ